MRSTDTKAFRGILHTVMSVSLGALTISCGGLGHNGITQSTLSSDQGVSQAASQRYFAYPLATFQPLSYKTNGSHPDYFSAWCDGDLLQTSSIRTYGTESVDQTLDLATGVISFLRRSELPGGSAPSLLNPPDRGGDYFAYVDALTQMQKVLTLVSADDASAFIVKALDRIKGLSMIDAVRFFRMGNGSVILSVSEKISIQYKTQSARDLLASFCDQTQCYGAQRQSLDHQAGEVGLTLAVPSAMNDTKSAYIRVQLVPQGDSFVEKVTEAIVKVAVDNFEYVSAFPPYIMTPGKSGNPYISYRCKTEATIMLKFFDKDGRVVAESSRAVPPSDISGQNSYLYLPYTLLGDAAIGEAKVVVRLVGADGSWDNYRGESQGMTRIVDAS